MKLSRLLRIVVLGVMLAWMLAPGASVSAHAKTTVGDYDLFIGFRGEPAYQGLPNGLELVVKNTKTGQPVSGLEDTLQAEIIFGRSKKELRLEPMESEEGAYTADVIPTEAGDYTWHIFGKIETTPVDVSITSSPTTFASVEPQADYAFPNNTDLQQQVSSARQLALAGLVVGGIGLLLGIGGVLVGMSARKRS